MILKYKEFLKESVFNFTGMNYAPKTAAQSLPATHHDGTIPRHTETDATGTIPNSMMYSETTGEYYDKFQVDDIVRQYDTWCKQNSEEMEFNGITNTKELDFILDKIS